MVFRNLRRTGRRRVGIAAAVVVAAVAGVLGVVLQPASSSATTQLAGASAARGGLDHVFVIMLENHSKSSVLGDPNAPYINQLADRYAVAGNYYGVTHPSEPNYVAAISGSNWWVNNDNPANRFDHRNLVDELEAHHKSWTAYMEALPSNALDDYWPSASTPLYASKHNPFVLFTDIRNDPGRLAHVKSYSDFASDLKSGRVAELCLDQPGPVQRHARRRLYGRRGPSGDAVPVWIGEGRPERRRAEAKG